MRITKITQYSPFFTNKNQRPTMEQPKPDEESKIQEWCKSDTFIKEKKNPV